ncbi:MAG TPA: hypothetical protein VND91_04840 [Candidatus Saccharimonadia bacterium]|nr:hypothetical protein [Candidatus Saccharimonadia bacterium]
MTTRKDAPVQVSTHTGAVARDRRREGPGVPIRIDALADDGLSNDLMPRQIARLFDAIAGSEWVIDARWSRSRLQVRAVEYASDGMWMPHVWRDVPEGSTVYFIEGRGIEVRHVS